MGIKANVPVNTTILEAAIQYKLPLDGLCNGLGTCGKCLVQAVGLLNEPQNQELKVLDSKLAEGWRLACQARVLGNVIVVIPDNQGFETVSKGTAKNYDFDPAIFKISSLPVEYFLQKPKLYGVAIDIGTTSIVASLLDLKDGGKEIANTACLNPQTNSGADVITRITYAHQSKENLLNLKEAVVNGINRLISELCTRKQVQTDEICHIVVAGNTTMLHLLVGIDPISLAVAPYNPVFVDYQEWKATDLGIVAQEAIVSLLPSLSAFVGADILAGMIATDFHNVSDRALFIDIGTNGEIVAHVNGRLVATSSAAGPALEGMNIQCGCRAEEGAISSVQIGEGTINIKTIASKKVKGLCGSGLVELVAELVKTKVLHPSGRFAEPADLPAFLGKRVIQFNDQPAFLIDEESGTILTQKDVRQVQLAKAAIAAAIEILFRRLEVDLSSVQNIYIAGAFGYHLKAEALKIIGLLPSDLQGKIEFVGNTAKEGARLCLVSRQTMEEILSLQSRIEPVELSSAPEFMENYVGKMNFPASQG